MQGLAADHQKDHTPVSRLAMHSSPAKLFRVDSKIGKITSQLRRNIIAQSAFKEALAGCNYLATLPADHDAYAAIWTGVSVTYIRPFLSSEGLGPLDPAKFERFGGQREHELIHLDLKQGRHSIDAHYSPGQAADFFSDPDKRREQKRLRFIRENGAWFVQPPIISWEPAKLAKVANLIEFQLHRLRVEATPFISILEQGKAWPDAIYYLGETFP
jgi:hypothetical protein